jgi:hypothetical protein
MPTIGRSIQIYLPAGEPRGARIAEFTTPGAGLLSCIGLF